MNARVLKESALVLLAGILFGTGLVISGMTQPQKVIGFLDLFGAWDASLMFVMMGAIAVHFVAHRLLRGKPSPLFAAKFSLPTRRDIDLRLVAGSALFGIGWGLGGYCPGPSITSLATGASNVLVFVGAMLVGMFGVGRLDALLARDRAGAEPAATR